MASYYKGTGLTAQQVAQVFYQAGWRGGDLEAITGIVSQRESRNSQDNLAYAGAHRTSTNRYGAASGDLGLAQINWGAWGQQLVDAGIVGSHTDLFDPVTNAKAALFVYKKQGWAAWGAGSGGWQAGGNHLHGVNIQAAQTAVASAQSQGLIGADYKTGATPTAAGGGGASGGLPRDARIVEVPGVAKYAMFQLVPGVWIRYAITADSGVSTAGRHVTKLSKAEWAKTFGNSVQGGDASELEEIPTAFGTYQAYTNEILDQLFPKGDPRRTDPEVLRVVATRAGRPDMTEAEFENLLKGTDYYQSRTEGQLRWNDLSEAERKVQRDDMEARMTQTVMSLVGQQASRVGGTAGGFIHNSTIKAHVEAVASGKMSYSAWTENVVKPFAETRAESPWARQVRDEQEAQRQRPMDIENSVARIRETAGRWGLNLSEGTLRTYARAIVENRMSDDDLTQAFDQQATALYAGKPKGMETIQYAAPWIETYNRVLERQGSLATAEIARALSAYGRDPENNDPWSFGQKLKMTDDYDQTRQGADDAYSTVGELAGMLGF